MSDGTRTQGFFHSELRSISYENMSLFRGNGLCQLSGSISVIMKFQELEYNSKGVGRGSEPFTNHWNQPAGKGVLGTQAPGSASGEEETQGTVHSGSASSCAQSGRGPLKCRERELKPLCCIVSFWAHRASLSSRCVVPEASRTKSR